MQRKDVLKEIVAFYARLVLFFGMIFFSCFVFHCLFQRIQEISNDFTYFTHDRLNAFAMTFDSFQSRYFHSKFFFRKFSIII